MRAGDTVAVMLPTSATAVTTWLGIGWGGGLEVPVSTALKGRLLTHVLADSCARVLVTDTRFSEQLADALADVPASLRRDRQANILAFGQAPRIVTTFEALVQDAGATTAFLAESLQASGWMLDQAAMARCVIPRAAKCYDGMLELSLLARVS